MKEADSLFYEARRKYYKAKIPDTEAITRRVLETYFKLSDGNYVPVFNITRKMGSIVDCLHTAVFQNLAPKPLPASAEGAIEETRYCNNMLELIEVLDDDPANTFVSVVASLLNKISEILPPVALAPKHRNFEKDIPGDLAQVTIPLHSCLPNPAKFVTAIYDNISGSAVHSQALMRPIKSSLDRAACRVSDITYTPNYRTDERAVHPVDYKGNPLDFLQGTDFEDLFNALIPITFAAFRKERMAMFADSGGGKTQTLQHFIAKDLEELSPPALVIIDSQNQMLEKIQRLKIFETRLPDRLVIIDPGDDPSPALNMFTLPERSKSYSRSDREALETDILELYNYVFAALDHDLTGPQETATAFVCKLLLEMPGATIATFIDVFGDPAKSVEESKFYPHIQNLDPIAQTFFQQQFYSDNNNHKRQLTAGKLLSILSAPAFNRMFNTKSNRLDMFDCLRRGKIVLVKTSERQMGPQGALFGRYILAATLNAAQEHLIATGRELNAYLIIDEISEYLDDKIETILAKARKTGLGLCFATQFLGEMDPKLRAAMFADTSIKIATSVSHSDATSLADAMDTNAEFIQSHRKRGEDAKEAPWAIHVGGLTDSAATMTVPFGTLEQQPRISDEQYARMREHNREKYCELVTTNDHVLAPRGPRNTDAGVSGDANG